MQNTVTKIGFDQEATAATIKAAALAWLYSDYPGAREIARHCISINRAYVFEKIDAKKLERIRVDATTQFR